jgi:hypothetical protein
VHVQWRSRAVPVEHARWLLGALERAARRGPLHEGQVVQIGSALVRLAAAPDGALTLEEPDFRGPSVTYRPGVDRTLLTLSRQRLLAESLDPDAQLTECPLAATCVVCTGARGPTGRFMLTRAAAVTPGDSGWFLGCLDDHDHDDADDLETTSVYAVLTRRPGIAPFLALPPTSRVAFDQGRFAALVAGREWPVREGSYLAACLSLGRVLSVDDLDVDLRERADAAVAAGELTLAISMVGEEQLCSVSTSSHVVGALFRARGKVACDATVAAYVRAGRRLAAIQAVRLARDCSMAEAKSIVDALA